MANLTESAEWTEGIYQLEITDPLQGGADGIDNVQAKQLANRTLYLKEELESHKADEGNPHEVTAEQVGAYTKGESDTLVEDNGAHLSALVDESKCRSLLDVLKIREEHSDTPASETEAKAAMQALHERMEAGNFSGLRVGDYLDLESLVVDGETYNWDDSYKNLRLMIMGFNIYKSAGETENTENHVVMQFRNCVLTRAMNSTNTNEGGYPASELCTWLNDKFKEGLISALGDVLYTVCRLLSNKGNRAWVSDTVFLPTEREVWGTVSRGEVAWDAGLQAQWAAYRDSPLYKVKRYNGSRQWWWEASPYDGSTASFCGAYYTGGAGYATASSVGGVAPAFCVA